MGTDVNKQTIPVIGGHAGTTIVPLLSQVQSHKQAAGVESHSSAEGIAGADGESACAAKTDRQCDGAVVGT